MRSKLVEKGPQFLGNLVYFLWVNCPIDRRKGQVQTSELLSKYVLLDFYLVIVKFSKFFEVLRDNLTEKLRFLNRAKFSVCLV